MRMRKSEQPLPQGKAPVRYCECGKPIYDGRVKKCAACKAAIKKVHSQRPSTIAKYALKEELLATIDEIEDSNKMLEWMLTENKKRVQMLKAKLFKL